MVMKKSGRLTNFLKSLNKEEYGEELRASPPKSKGGNSVQPSSNTDQTASNDTVISEMAKGFLEAQAKMAGSAESGGANSNQMIQLLQEISNKLDNLNNSNQTIQNSKNKHNSQTTSQQQGNNLSQELKGIFNQLLVSSNQPNSGNQNNSTNNNSGEDSGEQDQKSITAQTAAQVLAKAQYELSNELEASLTKLKQVISESEKIANRISNLLGEESGSNNS